MMNVRISQKISISLAPELCARARGAALARKVALSWLVARALESYLERGELQDKVRAPLVGDVSARLGRIERALARLEARLGEGEPKERRRYRGADDVGFLARAAAREPRRASANR